MKNYSAGLYILCFLLFSFIAYSQDYPGDNKKIKAMQYFSANEYDSALLLYQEFLTIFPKEPEYLYKAGVCLVKLNRPEEAIQMLKPVTSAGYDPLSWYYLGCAFHSYYAFEEAIKAYSGFMLKGKKRDVSKYNVERLIEMSRNGLVYTKSGHQLVVQNIQTIKSDRLETATINDSGKIMKKPLEFCTKTDINAHYRPWMFLPSFTEVNDYVYFSGFEPGKKNQKQIFRIKNIYHQTWGLPEVLNNTINTKYDEEYPYFDPRTSTLYFSSKGHSSMGGYDIFRSVYNWNTKSWSDPENMGFPINSTEDDFFYTTDALNHNASFISNRNVYPDEVSVYHIKLERDTSGILFLTLDQIRNASRLNVDFSKATENIVPVKKEISIEEISISQDVPVKHEYSRALTEALLLQLKADSIARIVRDQRLQTREMSNDSIKNQLLLHINRNEILAKDIQNQADLKFAEARNLKQIDADNISTTDTILTLKKETDGIKVYQYRAEKMEKINDNNKSGQNETEIFSIEKISPYNNINPIPRGLPKVNGLVYRIQMGVFSKVKPNDAFGGIFPIAYEILPGSDIIKYYAGQFFSINTVTKALETIRGQGFPDAFIVAFFNGTLISTEKAREIEFSEYKL